MTAVRRGSLVGLCVALAACSCETESAKAPQVIGYGVSDGCEGTPPSPTCKHPPVAERCEDGWCLIPKGCFVMGSPKCEWGRGRDNEGESETTLTHAFWMKATEVTQSEWTSLGLPNPSRFEAPDGQPTDCADGACPVGNQTWFEAVEYANRLSTSKGMEPCYKLSECRNEIGSGMVCRSVAQVGASLYECGGYRLPTEAEWEYAARAGTRTATYAGDLGLSGVSSTCGSDPTLDLIAWYCGNAKGTTHKVGGLTRNQWGLFDMSGNAFEWVNDLSRGEGYGAAVREDPGREIELEPSDGTPVTLRGGSATGFPTLARSAYRFGSARSSRGGALGFRLARTAK